MYKLAGTPSAIINPPTNRPYAQNFTLMIVWELLRSSRWPLPCAHTCSCVREGLKRRWPSSTVEAVCRVQPPQDWNRIAATLGGMNLPPSNRIAAATSRIDRILRSNFVLQLWGSTSMHRVAIVFACNDRIAYVARYGYMSKVGRALWDSLATLARLGMLHASSTHNRWPNVINGYLIATTHTLP